MNVDHPFLQTSPLCHVARSSTKESPSNATEMSVSDLVAAVESGKLELGDNTLMDSTPFFRVCLKEITKFPAVSK